MSIRKHIYIIASRILTTAFLMTAASGCVEEIERTEPADNEYLTFSAKLSDEATKAAPLTTLSGQAGIIGYTYSGEWPSGNDMNLPPWDELANKSFIFDGDQLVDTTGMIKWSQVRGTNSSRLRIYAYSPLADDDMTVSYGTEGNYSIPSITYSVPQDISKQKDIITATAEVKSDFNKNIPLTFNHILTGLKFKAGFGCRVNSITVSNVASAGTYVIGEGWKNQSGSASYTVHVKDKDVNSGDIITSEGESTVLFLIPQTFGNESTASVTLNYDDGKTITTSLKGIEWEEGRMITYTLHKKNTETTTKTIYFDLAAGDVTITDTGYTGKIYVNGTSTDVTGEHSDENRYYVYQSSSLKDNFNKNNTGYESENDFKARTKCRIPQYEPVKYNGMLWKDFIVGNSSDDNTTRVEDIIEIWDNGANVRKDKKSADCERYTDIAVARDAFREHTENYIKVTGANKAFNLTIDNIYTTRQQPVEASDKFRSRNIGGIAYISQGNTQLSLNFLGDNRMGCIHIYNHPSDLINIEGTGSLTVADADFLTVKDGPSKYLYYSSTNHNDGFGAPSGYISNFWNAAIGPNTSNESTEQLYNLHIYSGVIFAGTTAAEDCTAIGGGGNGLGQVFIHGGTVTAVATTAGTAIGGGMGHSAKGGPGEVYIYGGNIHAYNFENNWGIPSAAIGGGGSYSQTASNGTVEIKGGSVYAYSVLGTAIGGGSSRDISGGNAIIDISGGHVIAKSKKSNGIGGGTGGRNSGVNGGTATVTISGNPIIRTGSIGGGKTNNDTGHIGTATIDISGGDIQAQFVMAAGASVPPSFTMSGGLIRNSDTKDTVYSHIQSYGGAVYLEDGEFTMTGGEIRQCLAEKGGAIYIHGTTEPTFNMAGGKITECASETDGGAVYLEGGKVIVSGGEISLNMANNGNGGGFCIVGGDFSMPSEGTAKIFENAALSQSRYGGKGGGIFVTSTGDDVKVDIISGSITENSSDRVGGGICVDMTGHESSAANVTVGEDNRGNTNPSISSNHTIVLGGGLYAKGQNANITIKSGRIMDNTISGYVSNPDVANEEGTVTLLGGDVTSVTVTYNNNAKYLGLQDSFVEEIKQVIVTETKSRMNLSKRFDMPGYVQNGWNTRPDGLGKSYEDGDILNLKADLTLYAQWRRNL